MPTNEQRREAAKRKLERQLERRAQRARKRKQLTIAGSIIGVVVIVAGIALIYTLTKGDDNDQASASSSTSAPADPPAAPLPDAKPKAESVNCQYGPAAAPADKPANPPRTDGILTTGGNASVSLSVATNQGPIGLTLNNAESPCTVNSFVSLASQAFFDGTTCHRLTTAPSLKVLQCGDPSGTGKGGPGYQFANEYPSDQYAPDDQNAQFPVDYKRGVIAMANAGPNTNGSQFFLVYGDSQLPPQYTIFGTIDENGLQTLDKVAAAGVEGGAGQPDGKPALPLDLQTVRMD